MRSLRSLLATSQHGYQAHDPEDQQAEGCGLGYAQSVTVGAGQIVGGDLAGCQGRLPDGQFVEQADIVESGSARGIAHAQSLGKRGGQSAVEGAAAHLDAVEEDRLLDDFQQAGNAVFNASGKLLKMVGWLREALLGRARESALPETAPAIRTLICQMILETSRCLRGGSHSRDDLYVAEAVKFLKEHLGQRVRVADLAKFLGLGHTRVHEVFKRNTGLSPNDYLQRLRIETAQGLLLRTDLAITAVAGEVGFDTSQYFAAVFKKYTGETPTAFRKQQGEA